MNQNLPPALSYQQQHRAAAPAVTPARTASDFGIFFGIVCKKGNSACPAAEDDLCKQRYQVQSGSDSWDISLLAKPFSSLRFSPSTSVAANKGSSQFCDVSASGLTFDHQPGDLEMTKLCSLFNLQTFRTLLTLPSVTMIPCSLVQQMAKRLIYLKRKKSFLCLTWQRHVNVFGLRKFFNSGLKRFCVYLLL